MVDRHPRSRQGLTGPGAPSSRFLTPVGGQQTLGFLFKDFFLPLRLHHLEVRVPARKGFSRPARECRQPRAYRLAAGGSSTSQGRELSTRQCAPAAKLGTTPGSIPGPRARVRG